MKDGDKVEHSKLLVRLKDCGVTFIRVTINPNGLSSVQCEANIR